jgi:hypothetical protein
MKHKFTIAYTCASSKMGDLNMIDYKFEKYSGGYTAVTDAGNGNMLFDITSHLGKYLILDYRSTRKLREFTFSSLELALNFVDNELGNCTSFGS